jgi:arginyl-tRNA synthetase
MNIVANVQQALKEEIKQAIIQSGLVSKSDLPDILLETPKDKNHGDYSTNVAMQLARSAKKSPRAIAEAIIANLNSEGSTVQKVEIAGPGFINFLLNNAYLVDLIPVILEEGSKYGSSNIGEGEKIQVEFVSANPTGNLHLGHARGAAVGDSLCNVLSKAGYEVFREYYINDAGNQIHNLAKSIEARYFEALGNESQMPEDGYHGEDIIAIGKKLVEEFGDRFASEGEEDRFDFFRSYGLKIETQKLKEDLAQFRVGFDNWFSETSLYENGKILPALEVLRQNGHIFEEDGATWFRSTTFGDDKDRVLIKQDGSYTYLTPDLAYHKDKLDRGFTTLIDIWGADHHGYIPRMKAGIEALGYGSDKLEVEIIQMVQLYKDGEKMKMSKRTGKAVTLRELVEEVGLDAVRYFFAMRSSDTHMDFDLDLAVSQSTENPVYYAQYAHARICSILRQGEEQGWFANKDADLSLIQSQKEIELLKVLGNFPNDVAEAAVKRSPHRITHYVNELASAFHSFYNAEKVLDASNLELTKARLALIQSVQITLQNALALIGVSAPEKM